MLEKKQRTKKKKQTYFGMPEKGMRQKDTVLVTLDVAGGVSSPRHYGAVNKDTASLLSPSHPHSTHNQHNVTNSQHYPNSQHSSMMYHGTGNTINTADVQANQYCYDRTSVPIYQSAPGDAQDSRTALTSNPGHQLGGKP